MMGSACQRVTSSLLPNAIYSERSKARWGRVASLPPAASWWTGSSSSSDPTLRAPAEHGPPPHLAGAWEVESTRWSRMGLLPVSAMDIGYHSPQALISSSGNRALHIVP